MEVKGIYLAIATIFIVSALVVGFVPGVSERLIGVFSQSAYGDTDLNQGTDSNQDAVADADINTDATPDTSLNVGPGPEELPTYQMTNVSLFLMDALNPKTGLADVNVEVLDMPTGVYTYADLIAVASDPMRLYVDNESTASNGRVDFDDGKIFNNMPYIYAVRGGSGEYDKIVVKTTKAPSTQFAVTTHVFRDHVFGYKVGSFSDMSTDADNSLNCTDETTLNISGDTGLQYLTATITVAQADAGEALKDPVLVLRSPEGYELEPGDIVSLYITRYTGTNFDIPGVNLADYIDSSPIKLTGSIWDNDFKQYLMSVADSGTYTLKVTFDPTLIQTGTDRLQVALDDLGGYRAQDDVTKGLKATAQTLTLIWCE